MTDELNRDEPTTGVEPKEHHETEVAAAATETVADPGEDMVRWDGTEELSVPAESKPSGPPPIDPDEIDGSPGESVREAVLADVRAHFAGGGADESFAPAPTDQFVEDHWFDFSYLEGVEEVTRQWVSEPYAYVSILYDEDDKEFRYHVTEPALDGFERYVHEDLTRILRNDLLYHDLDAERDRSKLFDEEAKSVIADHAATVEGGTLYKLLYYLTRDFVDYAAIDPIMRDPEIEDISCDGVDVPVFVYHQEFRDLETNLSFDERTLDSMTVRLAQRAGKNISVSDPLVDASLPDGSRIQLTLGGEISTRGSNFTIRKFSEVPYTPVNLIEWNTFSLDEMAYFWLCIENGKSLVFAGGTGSGKTTSMNAVSMFIPPNAKVVSIEDTREITLPHDNWIQSVTRTPISQGGRGEVNMYELLQASLRQRPEYIVVGEIRTEQRVALTFFQAIGTGHTAYTTIHADSIEGALARLQNDPLSVPAQMLRNLDVVSIQRQIRADDERLRRNQAIVEILPGGDGEEVSTRTVFQRDPQADVHEQIADSHLLAEIRDERGWDDGKIEEELALRRELLAYLLENGYTDYVDVTTAIHTFAKDPEYVIDAVRSGTLFGGTLPSEGSDAEGTVDDAEGTVDDAAQTAGEDESITTGDASEEQ